MEAKSEFISHKLSELRPLRQEEHVTGCSQILEKHKKIANGNYGLSLQPIKADFDKKHKQFFLYNKHHSGRAFKYMKCRRSLERWDRLHLFCVCFVMYR
jgi:hypothetical protein